jgi:hypothetical protein
VAGHHLYWVSEASSANEAGLSAINHVSLAGIATAEAPALLKSDSGIPGSAGLVGDATRLFWGNGAQARFSSCAPSGRGRSSGLVAPTMVRRRSRDGDCRNDQERQGADGDHVASDHRARTRRARRVRRCRPRSQVRRPDLRRHDPSSGFIGLTFADEPLIPRRARRSPQGDQGSLCRSLRHPASRVRRLRLPGNRRCCGRHDLRHRDRVGRDHVGRRHAVVCGHRGNRARTDELHEP